MIRLLSRWLIPDRDNVSSPAVRRAYGTLCGAVGIALNILLFIGKFFADSCPVPSPSRRTPSTTYPTPAPRR